MPFKAPGDVNKGDPISARAFNMHNAASRMIFNLSSSGKNVSVLTTPNGVTISGDQSYTWTQPAQLCDGLNVTNEEIKRGTVVALTWPIQLQDPLTQTLYWGSPQWGKGARQRKRTVAEIRPPLDNGFGRFGIVGNDTRPHTVGPVYVAGICGCWIKLEYDQYVRSLKYRKPDRADTVSGKSYLEICELGAAQVLWIDDPLTRHDDCKLCVIRFDSRNTNGIGISEERNPKNDGVAEVIQFSNTVTLTELKSGIIQLDKTE